MGGGQNAQKRAFDAVLPGEVIVIEARGETHAATLGDILAFRALARGAEGIVTDGGVRDYDAVAEIGLPVFAASAHPAVLGRSHVPWDADISIACGGTIVQPGDVIVGDGDGVIVIPRPARRGGRRRCSRTGGGGHVDRRSRAGGAYARRALPHECGWRARYAAESVTGA